MVSQKVKSFAPNVLTVDSVKLRLWINRATSHGLKIIPKKNQTLGEAVFSILGAWIRKGRSRRS